MLQVGEETTPAQESVEDEDQLWEIPDGEQPDSATKHALSLAHRAIDRFPDLARSYRRFAGPAAIASTGLVLLAGIAIARRQGLGEHPDQILDSLTSDEIESAAVVEEKEKAQRHRQIQAQIEKVWSRLKSTRKKRGRRAAETGNG
jgi:hypothetical protein